jgi:hypothetical protein
MNNTTYIEAEYEDGYILNQLKNDDKAIYSKIGNTFTDILNFAPVKYHGKMTRFSLYHKGKRHDINWKMTPIGASPFIIKTMASTIGNPYIGTGGIIQLIEFGFEYLNINTGKIIKETITLN